MSKSRRREHHYNILQKYGRQNIGVSVIQCDDEASAHRLEIELIAYHRAHGSPLINITSGGEGAAGFKQNAAQKAAFARGRIPGKRPSPPDAIAITAAATKAWHAKMRGTPQWNAHMEKLKAAAREAREKLVSYVCMQCSKSFESKSKKAKFCSRLCEQRHRRARQANGN